MSIPLICKTCGDFIGVEPESVTLMRGFSGNFNSTMDVHCPGKGNHAKPGRVERTRFFGLLNRVNTFYPDTMTNSRWDEYVGPYNKLLIWFAITFGAERHRMIVNGDWCWGLWSLKK